MQSNNLNGSKVKMEKRLTTLEINQTHIMSEINDIKIQVSNHIPTQIKEFKRDVNEDFEKFNRRLWAFIATFAMSLLGLLLTVIFK